MRFWDTSALVPLVVSQPASARIAALLRRDSALAVWWGTPVEVANCLARLQREGALTQSELRRAQGSLEDLLTDAFEIQPTEEVRFRAVRLLAVHRLRAADALQLGAALLWSRERPRGVGFVSLDDRLRGVAAREGFQVLPYAEEVHEIQLDRDPDAWQQSVRPRGMPPGQ